MNKAMQYEEAKAIYGNNIRRAFTYKALNRLIQGSAADQTKKAMVDVYEQLDCYVNHGQKMGLLGLD